MCTFLHNCILYVFIDRSYERILFLLWFLLSNCQSSLLHWLWINSVYLISLLSRISFYKMKKYTINYLGVLYFILEFNIAFLLCLLKIYLEKLVVIALFFQRRVEKNHCIHTVLRSPILEKFNQALAYSVLRVETPYPINIRGFATEQRQLHIFYTTSS